MHSKFNKFGKLCSGHGTGKGFHSNPKERQSQRMLRLPHNCLISHASRVMLKIQQARVQQYMNHEPPDVQAGFRKGRGTRDQIANIHWIIKKKKRVPEKHLLLLYCLCQKPLTVWITTNCGKFFNRWECQTTRPAYRFLKKQVRWSGIPFSLRIFQFVVTLQSKSLV